MKSLHIGNDCVVKPQLMHIYFPLFVLCRLLELFNYFNQMTGCLCEYQLYWVKYMSYLKVRTFMNIDPAPLPPLANNVGVLYLFGTKPAEWIMLVLEFMSVAGLSVQIGQLIVTSQYMR